MAVLAMQVFLMSDHPFAHADSEWLDLIASARTWLSGPLGQLLLEQERQLLEEELARFFGGYLVHYGPAAETPPDAPRISTVSPALIFPRSTIIRCAVP